MAVEQWMSTNCQPLESPTTIRLVVLGSGSGTQPVECVLLHTDPNTWDAQPYEALSYEWGSPSDEDPWILVNGCVVQVRKNLWDALMHIRFEEEERYVWIDALSINQADLQERNHQVKIMNAIYRKADRVLVWLGLAKDGSDAVMTIFNDLGEVKRRAEHLIPTKIEGILALGERSYWGRAWVQQEIYLAKTYTIHCGSKTIVDIKLDSSLALLSGAAARDEQYRHLGRIIEDSRMFQVILMHRLKSINSLGALLLKSISLKLECSEPRDFIYSMRGMDRDLKESDLVPDYEKPLVEVYFDTLDVCEFGSNDAGRIAARLGISLDAELWQRVLISAQRRRGLPKIRSEQPANQKVRRAPQ
ncbi:hypothetical protein SLS60_008714 [Paraconiothyrium brasiliense]|uniref:Heterokaryon incompatibility domain-containing protein n=1 Tax=Paraconiothyrium brasiliense TaxID=300254 RepID=A0ABR3QZE9_9PLEO